MLKKIVFLCLAVFLLTGCSKHGLSVEYQDMNEELRCFTSFEIDEVGYIIDSQTEYETVMKRSPGQNCRDAFMPQIDFSKKTLIRTQTRAGGCSVDYNRKVFIDETAKTLTYIIEANGKGLCDMMSMSMNWALIPKIPADYEVDFVVN